MADLKYLLLVYEIDGEFYLQASVLQNMVYIDVFASIELVVTKLHDLISSDSSGELFSGIKVYNYQISVSQIYSLCELFVGSEISPIFVYNNAQDTLLTLVKVEYPSYLSLDGFNLQEI